VDGGLHARRLAQGLQGVLERQSVDHRREHPHVVGTGAVHAARRAAQAPEDVAAADHDRDLDAEVGAGVGDLLRDPADDLAVDAEVELGVGERLAGELEHHSPVAASRPSRPFVLRPRRP